jgi:hypothetical protein
VNLHSLKAGRAQRRTPRRFPSLLQDLNISDVQTLAVLGAGGFGRVTLVRHKAPAAAAAAAAGAGGGGPGSYFALKQMAKAYIKAQGLVRHVHREKQVRRHSDGAAQDGAVREGEGSLARPAALSLPSGQAEGDLCLSAVFLIVNAGACCTLQTPPPGHAGGGQPLACQPGGHPQG